MRKTMIYDNGCSIHIVGDKCKFLTLKKVSEGTVKYGVNDIANIKGKGIVSLNNRKTKTENVLYDEGLKHNLLSVSQMCYQGCTHISL